MKDMCGSWLRRGRPAASLTVILILNLHPAWAAAAGPPDGMTESITLSGRLLAGLLVGESSDFLDRGLGFEIGAAYPVGESDILRLRGDFDWIRLDDDRDELSGEVAGNTHLLFLVGPEIAWSGLFEPFVHGFAGVATNRLGYRIADRDDSDAAFAWGGGVGFRLNPEALPVGFEVGGRITDTGSIEYARAPGMDGRTAGSIRSDVAILQLLAGLRLVLH